MNNGQEQNTQRVSTQTVQNYDYIQYRLNNQPIIQKFEDTLSGIKREYIYDKETNNYNEIITEVNKPLINDMGKAAIISYFTILANSSTVQGNLKREELNKELSYISKHLAKELAINGKRWECVDTRRLIHYKFVDHLSIFLTRPINNLERESYLNVKQQESTVIKDNSKRFGFV